MIISSPRPHPGTCGGGFDRRCGQTLAAPGEPGVARGNDPTDGREPCLCPGQAPYTTVTDSNPASSGPVAQPTTAICKRVLTLYKRGVAAYKRGVAAPATCQTREGKYGCWWRTLSSPAHSSGVS
jgi:hypothetical protein